MFALIAAVIFLLGLLNVTLGSVNMMMLGLLFLALHCALTGALIPNPTVNWRSDRRL